MIQIFNPSSSAYGFITVLASVGTLLALIIALVSVGQSRRHSDLISKKNSLDHLFRELDSILDKVIYLKELYGSTEVHFGRLAIYRARYGQSLILFRNDFNLEHIENYIDSLNIYIGAMSIVLARLEDSREIRIYRKKITSELSFVNQYLAPLLIELNKSESSEKLLAKSSSILESIEALKELSIDLNVV